MNCLTVNSAFIGLTNTIDAAPAAQLQGSHNFDFYLLFMAYELFFC